MWDVVSVVVRTGGLGLFGGGSTVGADGEVLREEFRDHVDAFAATGR